MPHVYRRPRRTVLTPGYFGLGCPAGGCPRSGYSGLGDETPGKEAKDEIMNGYQATWGWDAESASHPTAQGPLLPSGEFYGEMPADPDSGKEKEDRTERAGTPALEQIAIWGTVGLLGYFLVGPFLGLKK